MYCTRSMRRTEQALTNDHPSSTNTRVGQIQENRLNEMGWKCTWLATNPFSITRKSCFLSLSSRWSSLLLFSCISYRFLSDLSYITKVRSHQKRQAKHIQKALLHVTLQQDKPRGSISVFIYLFTQPLLVKCPASRKYGPRNQVN